jgi:Protein of unknown function (DUF1592)/Protein of unknown function (DUF1588)/Protein of unknown function (DUF1595)/Protein of unknown function (DUF1585)/Protein of unknown function (DUF1587)
VSLTPRHATAFALACLAYAGGEGCYSGDAGEAPTAGSAQAPAAIGPAPLRRLSNVEYLNALEDLFPAQNLVLPALPSDVPVAGFENAAEAQQASDVRIARYEAIANQYAEAVTARLVDVGRLVGCPDWSTDELAAQCADAFLARTGRRVFRRPLTDAERERFATRLLAWRAAIDFSGAVQLTLSAMLQSPQFLYRAEPAPHGAAPGTLVAVEPFALASRLSFFLWESTPDDALLDAAEKGALAADDQLRAQAERMLLDARARRTLWGFHRQWLGLDRILLDEHAQRTPAVDPAWTVATQQAALKETQLFVENVLATGGTFGDLFTSRRAWVDGEMARVYGLPAPADPNALTETLLPDGERAGLLTRAAFLAGFSHRGATSPPVRGNGIQLRLLCQLPVSPPPGVDLSQPTAAPGDGPKTNRTLFEERTAPAACQSCHAGLNGFGFGLEKYDAAGHFHTAESGLPIDAHGTIHGTDVDGTFEGGIELSRALAGSAVVHRCATERLVRYALGRAPVDVEEVGVDALAKSFAASGGDMRALYLGVVTSPSFRQQRVEAP